MKFEIETFHRNTSEEELLNDLSEVYSRLAKEKIALTYRSYNDNGKYSAGTISTRFGTWNLALKKAGLELSEEKNVSDSDLFLNLENVWVSLGRQPVTRDLVKPLSKYRHQMYSDRFGSWRKALAEFVAYINEPDLESDHNSEVIIQNIKVKKRRTSRNISDRMRFRILSRDGFTCQSCGSSPIKERGVELHVDHKIPWSKGGETVEENLEAKCKQCNLGKGNAFSV